jgi:hypothetical protein
MIKIAGRVLEEISLLDARIHVAEPVVLAWAHTFEGQEVYPEEAVAAVYRHYQKPNPFPMMPGDVIGYCATCPVWSSREHASAFLDFWAQHPYSDTIEAHTGMQPPAITTPDSVDLAEERRVRTEAIQRWINENREQLVTAVMTRKHRPVIE